MPHQPRGERFSPPEAEKEKKPDYTKQKKYLHEAIASTGFSAELLQTPEGEQRKFNKIVLGHFDLDTVGAYIVALKEGLIDLKTPIDIQKSPKKAEIADPTVLMIEAARKEDYPDASMLESQATTLEAQGLTDIAAEIRKRIPEFDLTKEQYNATLGNITHTGSEEASATAQLFALTGQNPEMLDFASYVHVTDTSGKPQRTKKDGNTFAELIHAIKDKYAPGGRFKKENLSAAMQEIVALYDFVTSSNQDFFQRISINEPGGEQFQKYPTQIEQKKIALRETLKTTEVVDIKETATGAQIMLATTEAPRAVFAQLRRLHDFDGYIVLNSQAEAAALSKEGKPNRYVVKISGPTKGSADLAPLADALNAMQLVRGGINLRDVRLVEEDSDHVSEVAFGGHANFIGTPLNEGTTIKPEHIFALIEEYFSQERPNEKELAGVLSANGINPKNTAIDYIAGIGEFHLPELAATYVKTSSGENPPVKQSFIRSGYYENQGLEVITVRSEQIDTTENRIIPDDEMVRRFLETNQPEKALTFLFTKPLTKERKALLENKEIQRNVWQAALTSPEFAKKIYCPLESNYFALDPRDLPPLAVSDKDKAKQRFFAANDEKSPSYYVDTTVLASMRESLTPEEYFAGIQNILQSKEVRDANTHGQIFGRLHKELIALVSNLDSATLDNPKAPQRSKTETSQELQKDIIDFITHDLSHKEMQYLLETINTLILKASKVPSGTDTLQSDIISTNLNQLQNALAQQLGILRSAETESSFPNITIETNKDTHPRKVVTVEIGRRDEKYGRMATRIAKQLQEETGTEENPKHLCNVSIERPGFATDQEILDITTRAIEGITALAKENPTTEIEVYLQAPQEAVANIFSEIAKRGINARLGKWDTKTGRYVLTPKFGE
ncbi:hypothetical protein KKH43_01500 [Patescibacteria group bacterium]|nr:hypothetical protein [Patescibacteria group bacterium]